MDAAVYDLMKTDTLAFFKSYPTPVNTIQGHKFMTREHADVAWVRVSNVWQRFIGSA